MPLPDANTPPPVITLDQTGVLALANELVVKPVAPNRRKILAIAGIPGSGKSTLANALTRAINQARPGSALMFGMDAFHMANDKLVRLGLRDRKGAPQTFEAQRYIKVLSQLSDAARNVQTPIFERGADEPIYTGKPEHTADRNTRFIITEGNYLLLDTMPWSAISELADLTVWLDTPVEQAKRWVIDRHIKFGRSPQDAEQWYEHNDRLNVQHILDFSRHADLIARWP